MADVVDHAKRLQDLLDKQDGRIARAFRDAIMQARGAVDLAELAQLIEQGRIEEAYALFGRAEDITAAAINSTFTASAQSTSAFLAESAVAMLSFDQVNLRAVQIMQQNRLTFIREFGDEQRAATQAALVRGAQLGQNPRDQARAFRDSIGLTERQTQAVANYRAALERVGQESEADQAASLTRALRDKRGDAQVRRAINQMRPLPKVKVDWLVQRYSERYVKYRAEVIGRTEALRAVHQGNEEMYRQAIDSGDIDQEKLERTWRTNMDGRERRTHEWLNGVKSPFGVPWITQNGPINYPGDPAAPASETVQCRCSIATRIRG